MKLSEWAEQYKILEINAALPERERWPKLAELFAALEAFPRVSTSSLGYGIFLGWRDTVDCWVYHHAVCVPSAQVRGNRYGFHEDYHEGNIIDYDLIPTFNVGDLPESADFLRIMQELGFEEPQKNFVVTPRLRLC